MAQPRITIITPCRNHAAYLEQAMCSVLDQAYPHLEYIVVDGGSNDGSLDILQHYEDHLAAWVSEPDAGPADAINHALEQATGDIVGIVCADDLLLPGSLERVAQTMNTPDAPEWIAGDCIRIGPSDQYLGRVASAAPKSLASFLMHNSGQLPLAGSFFRAELLREAGPLDTRMRHAFDYELVCRLLASGNTPTILSEALVARRQQGREHTPAQVMREGIEYLAAARRYADHLPLAERYGLWRNCDHRERIYALAQAELYGREARRFLWQQIVRRPWWLANDNLRHALVHGIEHPVPRRTPSAAA